MRAEPGTPERDIEKAALYGQRNALFAQLDTIGQEYSEKVADVLTAMPEAELPVTIEAMKKVVRDFVPIAPDAYKFAARREVEAGARSRIDIGETYGKFFRNVSAAMNRRFTEKQYTQDAISELFMKLREPAIPAQAKQARLQAWKGEKPVGAEAYYAWIKDFAQLLLMMGKDDKKYQSDIEWPAVLVKGVSQKLNSITRNSRVLSGKTQLWNSSDYIKLLVRLERSRYQPRQKRKIFWLLCEASLRKRRN